MNQSHVCLSPCVRITANSPFWICLGLVLALSLGLHLPFFWHPAQVIFDEYHFGKFINAYCCSKATIFDIHPPHAKLIMAWLVKQAGYSGNQGFQAISESYLPGTPLWAFRLWPVVMGTAVPVIGYCLLWVWGSGVAWALAAGVALAMENSLLLQTGIIALDGQLIFGSMAALLVCEFFLAARQLWKQLLYGFLIGLCLAFAVSAKFTGLAAVGVTGVRILFHFATHGFRVQSLPATTMATVLAILGFSMWYLTGWWLHFNTLQSPGPGTAFYAPTGNFFIDLVKLHKIMLTANNSIKTTHPWQSEWWQWPFMKKAIYYWSFQGLKIFLVGNPWVWWGSHVAALSLYWRRRSALADFLVIAWLGSYLPYALVSRGLFIYHYQPPLIWMILLALLLLSRGPIRQSWQPWHVIALTVSGFFLVAPVTYGWSWWLELPIRILDLH